MKILISVRHFDPPGGGAELSLATLAKKMAEKHEIRVVQSGQINETRKMENIQISVKKVPLYDKHCLYPIIYQAENWKKIIEEEVKNYSPDLLITQLSFAPSSVDIAHEYGIPSIFFIRSYEHFCPNGFIDGIECNGHCRSCIKIRNHLHFLQHEKWLKWNCDAMKKATLLVANSNFVSQLTEKKCGTKPNVLYPSINIEKYHCKEHSANYIAMIKPTKVKGLEIFLKIVKAMPEKQFIAVGGNKTLMVRKKLSKLENLEILGWTKDITKVYAKTRIMLAPVLWPEPFGRAIIEAGINGIPTIASEKGGIPEAVGDGGILIHDSLNTEEWVKAINALDEPEYYAKVSKNARNHAENFNFESNFQSFKKIIESQLKMEL